MDGLFSTRWRPARLIRTGTRVRASRAKLVEALRGRLASHGRLLLRLHLAQADSIDEAIAEIDRELGERLEPFRKATELLTTMPGIGDVVAQGLVSEIGVDMTRFPSAAHLVSWAGMCPGQDESAGKQRSRRMRKGPKWL